MEHTITIRRARKPDLGHVDAALRALAGHLADPYRVAQADIAAAAFGTAPSVLVQIALDGQGRCLGVLLASPVFSTMQGGPGLFVNDLWVDARARGQGIARRLLCSACREAGALWGAPRFIRLMAHDHNTAGRDFYERMGFDPMAEMGLLSLQGTALDHLEGTS